MFDFFRNLFLSNNRLFSFPMNYMYLHFASGFPVNDET